MIETKMRKEMDDSIVLEKKKSAEKWCVNASDYVKSYSGKPWKYLLIPHDEIADNITVDGLAKRF